MKRIVVLGAGYAGMRIVKKLAGSGVDAQIVLVNKNPYHYQSTQLHEVAAGTKEPADITFDVSQAFAGKNNVQVIIDEVVRIDQDAKSVELKDNAPLQYDYLVNSLGFESETFGIAGANENGWPIIDIDTALAARKHLEDTLKRYKASHDPNDLRIIVCGAGFTSIEYLGELVHRLPRLAKEYGFPLGEVKIDCIEAGPKILGMFDQNLAQWGVKYLEKKGVTFHVSTPITEVKPNAVMSNDQEFPANTIIWTTGVHGSHVVADSGYDQKRNRVIVADDLRVNGQPDQFLIGDVSGVMNPSNGRLYPTTAQISIAQADCAADNLIALMNGQPTKKFVFKALGTVCSLGPTAGIASIDMFGHWNLKGWIASVAKKMISDRAVLELTNIGTMLESD
ncbi:MULTISPECIES: NAD(P)/FAD-dependent oxidoreductase [unclassified Bifidobacterium]|uniref:NAD(P)/FAD-dependent oxidoreductase n=1 Tax=unclassified Bifidobacterium TaxID=2608897 RepID=UPI0023F866C4|nr:MULTISPECIES: NAD(P)/FAD-dependent oxidoreductase [unclassified Bifidobacterium]WEV65387.1 NAD(P)/FAD-dependent oxidoreductase [Bifidobacterium sp. ESL0764]WEV75814.1 NAD(P)/FAD-dependent oxidoreductase [Bifidobacterium sp. ESL0800]